MRCACWVAAWCVLGCGEDQWPALGDAISVGDPSGGEEEEELTHGSFGLRLERSENEPASPFVGTAEVVVTVTYDSCFSAFYDMNPEYRMEAVLGAEIFGTFEDGGEGWLDRLCAPTEVDIACTVVEFVQQLQVAKLLTVRYSVPDNPENHDLRVGPFPLVDVLPQFTCDGGSPRVQINPQQIRGTNAAGDTIWEGETLDRDMASPGQAESVVVKASRSP